MNTNNRNNKKNRRPNIREMSGPTGVDDLLNQLHDNVSNDKPFDTISNGSISGNEDDHLLINTRSKNIKKKRKNKRRELDMGF